MIRASHLAREIPSARMVYSAMSITDIASIALAISAIASLLYISRQVNMARHQAKGQFLLGLDEQFAKSAEITVRLMNDPDFKPEGLEWGEVWLVMSVYERMNIMIEDKILDIGLADRLYGFRLNAIIANDAIYERV